MFNWLEKHPFFFAVAVFVVIAYAGIVEILPDFADRARPVEGRKPYTVLQLAGRHIYIKDSCNACHSQLIRPFKSETDRYGAYSKSGEYAYDRPFLWGSKRTGPDLFRVGNYRTTDWHENHMKDPTSVVPGSLMPAYKHMFSKNADIETAYAEALTVKKAFNVPYDMEGMPKLGTWDEAKAQVKAEAEAIVNDMKDQDVKDAFERGEIRQIVALIAYLNSLK
ncbi:Cytochrome c oxidase subunit CcoO [Campylobacter sputorum subsp. bubulus]|uniref:Cytochrome c oxidase subunit CcoO n=1 Tax=Campylobacter sputorum subsp. sputorum TaxID=32024 RepID=A0A381DK15_9BACT|nr:cytochrome-c oxidase, cbb3-type subunit II [Campylobacter sputorum]ASM34381.1 cytochrome c oxidase CcoNOPQ, cbb3-type, membrane-bound monoheme cytochrome c subunit II [Campylobacter sputorum aubsp. sputorum RM3237]ASM36049.1 cytochrome c oxidase CcoNOPQ, cbb3-type, membrane-bound monoheme cytochrome c subunit II [Campylobacter sputorum bv. faecalis CCUG 20703]KAB0582228.1 cytochrome-c oxidase, cbb3-type subunit II [Campylobacter sputorum subsp. sputorum]QEL04572.1 cytochrome c oxidase CcoNOP